MGLFVSSDVLSNSLRHTLTVEAPVAMLPVRSPLQTHLPFQVGLRTGLCGSLTTFASWQLQMVIMIVGGKPMQGGSSQWAEAVAGLIIGCMTSLVSLVTGQHLALYVYHKLNPGAFIPFGSPAPEQLALEEDDKMTQQQQQQQQRSSADLGRVSGEGSLTAAAAAAAAGPFDDQFLWWAILFGPVGCYLRFYLSRYNGALHGHWKWFPAGTFAANMAACVLDYVIRAAQARVQGLDAVQLAVLNGMVSGIGGCLSTVSTWVVEIQRLMLSFPNTSHGYSYMTGSIVTAVALGLLIYGIPVWTMT
ncbi:hypothetical protein OEZ85_003514 [Tetradesmus obliquus]|uniref:Fluoride ion transporter CrcB n=1 Tax=Tetradesmus obliquus TaxID=3088 RepID=A0ABY8UBR9_TETOB|nr:hypothetical protein OEZ85_003514 [Tetradesmus obliquus]